MSVKYVPEMLMYPQRGESEKTPAHQSQTSKVLLFEVAHIHEVMWRNSGQAKMSQKIG